MKKFLSAIIAVMITLICMIPSVSATEEAKVKSIEIKKLPDKLTYSHVDTDWKISSYTKDYKDEIEKREDFDLEFRFDLRGISVLATYEDGATEEISKDELSLSVLNNVKLGEVADVMYDDFGDVDYSYNMDVLYEKLYRDYTVEVEYKGATDTFDISLVEYDTMGEEDESFPEYEFVSYSLPKRTVYDIDTECSIEINDGEIPREYEYIEIDVTGMTATLRNCDTGEEVVFYEDDMSAYIVNYPEESGSLKTGEHMALGEVYVKESEYSTQCVDFEFPVTLIKSSEGMTIPESDTTTIGASDSSTSVFVFNPISLALIIVSVAGIIVLIIVFILIIKGRKKNNIN